MKLKTSTLLILILVLASAVEAQRRRSSGGPGKGRPAPVAKTREVGSSAIVIDETLSVLREKPGLFADVVQRMRRGRQVKILGTAEADGVKFYKVSVPPNNFGYVQADAVFGKFREGDESRLAALIQASDGFDRIEIAAAFLELYPRSTFAPAILLLYGDLLEETAVKLSRDASSKLSRREMAATAAPLHSYYLNFVSLDRYRKLGIVYLFNPSTRTYHYNGESWKRLVRDFPSAKEASEAQARIESVRSKMSQTAAN